LDAHIWQFDLLITQLATFSLFEYHREILVCPGMRPQRVVDPFSLAAQVDTYPLIDFLTKLSVGEMASRVISENEMVELFGIFLMGKFILSSSISRGYSK